MERIFEWDEIKAKTNIKNHQTSFEEATTVFNDPLNETNYDIDHSMGEDRYITIGWSSRRRLLMAVFYGTRQQHSYHRRA